MAWPPSKSSRAEVRRSVLNFGSRSTRPMTRLRFLPEAVAGGLDAVAADVEERSAAALDLVADVGRVVVEVAEESCDGAQLADAAGAEEFAHAEPLRVAADHEGFADLDAGAVADGEEGPGFGDSEADRFFAEHVLAGFGGLDGPGDVELVGQGIVDGVDVGIGEQFFVGAVCLRDIPSAAAASLALLRSREAMASTVVKRPSCMAGMTFFRPMVAVLSTPQRSFLDMH